MPAISFGRHDLPFEDQHVLVLMRVMTTGDDTVRARETTANRIDVKVLASSRILLSWYRYPDPPGSHRKTLSLLPRCRRAHECRIKQG